MSTNPFSPHTSNLFASRGCDLDAAMTYARELIDNISPADRTAATTAIMVVINTAANAWTQSQGPSPEKLAVEDMIRAFVTRELDNQTDRMLEAINDAVEEKLDEVLDEKVADQLDEQLDDKINDWMNDNLEAKMEGEALCEAIRDAFRNNLSISIN